MITLSNSKSDILKMLEVAGNKRLTSEALIVFIRSANRILREK